VLVRLSEGRIIVGEGDPAVAECATRALEGEIAAPYRAVAVRREGTTWAVGAVAIQLADLPADLEGDNFVLTVTEDGERELIVDGQRSLHRLAEIAALGGKRHGSFVVRAERLEGALWEVTIDPL
jgi:hypothetical protein